MVLDSNVMNMHIEGNEYYEEQYKNLREKMKNKNYKQWKDMEDEKIPFCQECHSYPCSCEDNI